MLQLVMADLIPPSEKITPVQTKPDTRKWSDVFKDIPDIGSHTINLALALTSVWLIHLVLEHLLGKEAKFFDWIPIRYVADFADIVLILKFIWHLIKNFNR
jgi:hypothetical protein